MALVDTWRLAREFERGRPAPLYLLYGEEDYLMEEALRQLEAAADRSPFPARERHLGKEVSARDLTESAATLPLGGAFRLVVVEEAQQIPAAERDKLLSYVDNPCPTTCLVFVWRDRRLAAKDRLVAALKQKAQVVEFARLRAGEINAWARARAQEMGLAAEPAALEALVQGSGGGLRELAAELDKAALSVPQGGSLTLASLQAMCRHGQAKTWDVAELACQGNAAGALLVLDDLLAAGGEPGVVLRAVSRHLRKLLMVAEMEAQGLAADEMAQRLGSFPAYVRGYVAQAARCRDRLTGMLGEVLAAERDLKTSAAPGRERLERLVLSLAG